MGLHVLAFDTSSQLTAVAITRGEQVLFEDATPTEGKHAQTLLPRVQAGLAAAQLSLSDIGLIAVGLGPGSFTGVRVGLATAKGFALASGTPVRGVVSLEALAHASYAAQVPPDALVSPLLDAHKGEVFAAVYARTQDGELQELLPPFHDKPERAASRVAEVLAGRALHVLGTGLRRYAQQLTPILPSAKRLSPELDEPRASCLAHVALRAFQGQGAQDLAGLLPMYLRASDAQLPKSALRLT